VLEKKSVVTREDFVKAFMHGKLDITLFEDATLLKRNSMGSETILMQVWKTLRTNSTSRSR
jgi:hypothetical protein